MSRGTSTQKVERVAETLMGITPSKSSVSRLNQTLTEQFEAWRIRKLQSHWRLLYLDGIYGCQCVMEIKLMEQSF